MSTLQSVTDIVYFVGIMMIIDDEASPQLRGPLLGVFGEAVYLKDTHDVACIVLVRTSIQ